VLLPNSSAPPPAKRARDRERIKCRRQVETNQLHLFDRGCWR
jgi:hypothetical protein